MNDIVKEFDKKINNQYELIEEGLKDIISYSIELLSILESSRYLDFIKKQIKS